MKQIALNQLFIGNIDAKNEILRESQEEISRFMDNYLLPSNVIIDKFKNREKYFVTGMKGIGKTALLRYLSIMIERSGSKPSFILFKEKLTEEDKKAFSFAAHTTVIDGSVDLEEEQNFELIWMWFIHKHLIDTIKRENIAVFVDNKNYEKYLDCINAPKLDDSKSGIKRFLPKIKRGKVEISKDPKLNIDFDWDDKARTSVKFNSIIKQLLTLFEELKLSDEFRRRIDIFVDELEIKHTQKKLYSRDCRMIRDLIIVTERFNRICKSHGFPITIYAAIRSEVLSAVYTTGKEINKIMADFGVPIIWHQSGGDENTHPLLSLITKRLATSLRAVGIETPEANIWDSFFPEKVQGDSVQRYILHSSWYRPRDVIRLLTLARDVFPNETKFTHQVFDGIRKQYATASWIELTEELSASYSHDEIEAIKRIFYGYKSIFTLNDLHDRLGEIRDMYQEVKQLTERHEVTKILTDLYRIGIIGNRKDNRFRFSFRGDDEILLEQPIVIHFGIKSYLSIF